MIRIQKRNGKIVEYAGGKIIMAITSVMLEKEIELNPEMISIPMEIERKIKEKLKEDEKIWTVEEISNEIENELLKLGKVENARDFMNYRVSRANERKSRPTYQLLSKEFLSNYKHQKSPMTEMGNLVYYRTYSRYIQELQRREYWWETVARAVDYNCSLSYTTKEEAEELYDNIFNLRQFLSGRTFWTGGTEVARKYPMSNYNCAFTTIDSLESFKDLFYLLMIGSGVGLRILKTDVEQLPRFRAGIDIIHKQYSPVPKVLRKDNTSLENTSNEFVKIYVGDSKEGWVQALDFLFMILTSTAYANVTTVAMYYDNVRPKGEPLKTFGGTASGHGSLENMFNKIISVINSRSIYAKKGLFKLQPIDCLDIANIIGENVVVGGRLNMPPTLKNTL